MAMGIYKNDREPSMVMSSQNTTLKAKVGINSNIVQTKEEKEKIVEDFFICFGMGRLAWDYNLKLFHSSPVDLRSRKGGGRRRGVRKI
jgi:hypothetical protein